SSDERVPLANQRAAALEKRLPRLTVRMVGPAPAGTKIARNDVELSEASLGTALPVDPGTYQVVVTAPGYEPSRTEIAVVEATNASVDARLGAPTGGSDVAPKKSGGSRTAGWVVGGIGVAGLVVGGIAGVLTLDRKGTVDANCNADK